MYHYDMENALSTKSSLEHTVRRCGKVLIWLPSQPLTIQYEKINVFLSTSCVDNVAYIYIYIWGCCHGKGNQITTKEEFKGNLKVMVWGMEGVVVTRLVESTGNCHEIYKLGNYYNEGMGTRLALA